MSTDDVGSRIRVLRLEKKLTQAKLAVIAGVSSPAVTQWESGLQKPKAASLKAMAEFFNVSDEWLLTGSSETNKDSKRDGTPINEVEFLPIEFWDDDTPLGDDEVEAYFYKEVEIAAGHGSSQIIEDHKGRKVRFGKRSLKNNGIDPHNIACALNSGRSMERLIMDGAMLMIDKSKNTIKDGRIFAFDHGGVLRCKYLYKQPKGGLLLRSENVVEFPDEILTPEDVMNDVRLLGWVFDWSKMQKW